MARILVVGLTNLETTLRVDSFPLSYEPVRYPFGGVRSTISGVGFNVAKALAKLGDDVRFLTLVGDDPAGRLSRAETTAAGLESRYLSCGLSETAQSVILHEPGGRRAIHVDLKENQEAAYPTELFEEAAEGVDLAVLCNINFARPLLARARARGIPVATDLHALSDPDDAYNADFLRDAEILFLSHERLTCPAEDFVGLLRQRSQARVIGIGMGGEGGLLAVRGEIPRRFPASPVRAVANTIGAGDAFFAAFIHFFVKSANPAESFQRAIRYAARKIESNGGADGLLTEAEFEANR